MKRKDIIRWFLLLLYIIILILWSLLLPSCTPKYNSNKPIIKEYKRVVKKDKINITIKIVVDR